VYAEIECGIEIDEKHAKNNEKLSKYALRGGHFNIKSGFMKYLEL
jgi:hypothetical protein